MEYDLDSVKTMMDKPQIQEVFMGRLAIFWGGILAGVAALGAASFLISEFDANKEIDRDESDDGCLAVETAESSKTSESEYIA